jgi:hypothetical protein
MQFRTKIAAVGAAAIAGTGAFVLPAVAGTHATKHTLKFTAVTMKSANFSKYSGGQAEKDLNAKGKIIGFDVIYFAFNPKTMKPSGNVALTTKGGILYGVLKFSKGPVTRGKVTGGTGVFKGTTGTIVGRDVSKNRTKVTVTYHH